MDDLTMALESELLLHITSGKSLASLRRWIEDAAREQGHPESLPFDMSDDYAVRFSAMIETTPDCWLWRGSCDRSGYGQFIGKRAHRVAWELVNGRIAARQFICHKCDNPICVRPDHLFLGSHEDNMRDMVRKGRSTKGIAKANWNRKGRTKLDPGKALEILALKGKERPCDVARKYGVVPSAVQKIWSGERWRHATVPAPLLNVPDNSATNGASD